MQNDPPILQCPNYFCQTLNAESQHICSNCQTPLPKRYLWAVGVGLEAYRPGDLIGDRYRLKSRRILLDTQPGLPPDAPLDITPSLEAYLRLIPHRLHVPQIYSYIESNTVAVVLLEQAPIYPNGARSSRGEDLAATLMPDLLSQWTAGFALRQLNWLWQIAQLWQPLSLEKVASTLLTPDLLRVDGGLVRSLELAHDAQPPTLAQLGHLWSQWQPSAHPAIADFLNDLCYNLAQEQIKAPEHLVSVLDQALADAAKGHDRQIHIATATDQGPSRQTNEDACYPAQGANFATSTDATPLPVVIVCDGIGGHEGGEVASDLAIATITEAVEKNADRAMDAASLTHVLDEAVCEANNEISQQNDVEHRQERQRMGTTVVLGLAHAHEVYLAHVGDSRAYRVTRTGCYQVTLDDDVASREVRLGYTLYRAALQHPASGSLVQALGMGSSTYLHPTVQRFVLDEDCVFLLCSDGLSDNDRIEECWARELAPLVDGTDLAVAARRLVEIANTRNGHDNVTIGLLRFQIRQGQGSPPLAMATTQPSAAPRTAPTADSVPHPSRVKTQIVVPVESSHSGRWLTPIFTLLGLLGLGGVLAFLLIPELRRAAMPPPPSPTASPPPTIAPEAPPSPNLRLASGSLLQLERDPASPRLPLLRNPEQPIDLSAQRIVGQMPSGSVLQVVGQRTVQGQRWIALKVCSVPPTAGVGFAIAGQTGWQQERAIAPFVNQSLSLQPNQLGACAPASPSPTPSPTPSAAQSPIPNR
ncbi:PP2C family protein-serine/threonine phosphatase [Myxacorys almedinensis]|uniref:SpoIIE family protein phosphatase n=1 Tax=Myxacorys almedinensis A TaxID=2690445 RepID=A0A8J8CMT2_9CYAN|nr:protein phosphatase 2C domain-containing protein [Myxacorys almedinensis]NDJ17687.1 SpoIIE family protein phosphatase [Myxacorys almedinensis A]